MRLTRRDEVLLVALQRFRVARTTDLLAYCFDGVRRDTAARRLRRLFDGGFLEVRSRSRSDENLYRLGPEGRAFVHRSGQAVGSVPRGDLAHHLAIVQVWIEVARLVHADHKLQVDAIRPDWELRVAHGEGALVPDLAVRLLGSAGAGQRRVLRSVFEIDLGTEPLTVLTRKFRTYERLRGTRGGLFGWRDFSLLVAALDQGETRRRSIARLLEKEWSGPWALVAEVRELWTALPRILGSPDSPYGLPSGKGRADAVSVSSSKESPAVSPVLYGTDSRG